MRTVGALHRTPLGAAPPDPHAKRALGAWLREAAWPLWLAHGVDWQRGGFVEDLDPTSFASAAPYRRLRVAARQVFVFAQAAREGMAGAAAAVELGIGFLTQRARGIDGGYARQFDLHGNVTDPRRDLYDHAFVLLAFASAARILPAAPLERAAMALLGYLENLRRPSGGYAEGVPATLPRRQNPHMHLLEAFLAAHEAFGAPVFLERAAEMVGLFLNRFIHPQGVLVEYYDDAWGAAAGVPAVFEPGHHCEWVWLLHWFAAAAGAGHAGLAQAGLQAAGRLLDAVETGGINRALGTLYDEVSYGEGLGAASGSRLWPQTEWLKVALLYPDRPFGAAQALDRYIAPAPPGLWRERLRADGSAIMEPVPASSLYHLTSCILFAGGKEARGAAPNPAGAEGPGPP